MSDHAQLGEWKCSLLEIYGLDDIEQANCDLNIDIPPEPEEPINCDSEEQETEASSELDIITVEHNIIQNEHRNIIGVIFFYISD